LRLLVISDTHENLVAIEKIHELANKVAPDAIIHCGDYISPIVIRRLLKFGYEIWGVWGNNDGDKDTILHLIKNSKITIESQPREITIGGFKALMMHGWRSPNITRKIIRAMALNTGYKYLFYGHTHIVELSIVRDGEYIVLREGYEKDETFELGLEEFDTLVLNPGEASGILTSKPTYALLDISRSKVTIKIAKLFPSQPKTTAD